MSQARTSATTVSAMANAQNHQRPVLQAVIAAAAVVQMAPTSIDVESTNNESTSETYTSSGKSCSGRTRCLCNLDIGSASVRTGDTADYSSSMKIFLQLSAIIPSRLRQAGRATIRGKA